MTDRPPTDAPDVRDDGMLRDVREGLTASPKELPPKYFYDERGSELFEAITRLPEYYPTRTERSLLEARMPGWIGARRPRSLVELGAGSAGKTRIVLDAMTGTRGSPLYVPVDVSGDFLRTTAARLRDEFPRLSVEPVVADFSRSLPLPDDLPRPAVFAFLGSTVGNFSREEAVGLLERIAGRMEVGDRLLMGFDLKVGPEKPRKLIEAAYNDEKGVTAEFNRNVLRVLNRELGADFDPAAFAHRAHYDTVRDRIEMRLVSRTEQEVRIPGVGTVDFDSGESIRTEISWKYDRRRVETFFRDAGLRVEHWWTDPQDLYALGTGALAEEAD